MSNKTDKNRNKSVSQYEVGAADLEKVSGGTRTPEEWHSKPYEPKKFQGTSRVKWTGELRDDGLGGK